MLLSAQDSGEWYGVQRAQIWSQEHRERRVYRTFFLRIQKVSTNSVMVMQHGMNIYSRILCHRRNCLVGVVCYLFPEVSSKVIWGKAIE